MSARGLLCGSRARTAPRRRAAALGSYRRTRVWLSPPQLSRDVARRGGPLLLVLFSRPVRRSARAPLLRSTRARRPRSARSDDRREDARRRRRPATGREKRTRTTAARDVPAELRRPEPPAMYARRARRPSPPARRALDPQGAATAEKTPDEDEDRRRDERKKTPRRAMSRLRCSG